MTYKLTHPVVLPLSCFSSIKALMMIILIILEHSHFRRKKNHNPYWALFSPQTKSKGYNYFHADQHHNGFYFSSYHETLHCN